MVKKCKSLKKSQITLNKKHKLVHKTKMSEEVITIDSDDDDDPAPGPSSSSMSYSPANYSNMIPVSLDLGMQ